MQDWELIGMDEDAPEREWALLIPGYDIGPRRGRMLQRLTRRVGGKVRSPWRRSGSRSCLASSPLQPWCLSCAAPPLKASTIMHLPPVWGRCRLGTGATSR